MFMAKPKVVVAGHICIDITPIFPTGSAGAATAQKAIQEILSPGKLTRVRGVDIHAGGVVANTGLAMHLFGAEVSLMGKVGKDAFGSMILSLLRERGAGDGMIVSNGASTSYSIVIAIPGCDRIFLHDPGANDDFRFSDLDFESNLFHFGYPTLMASMFRNGGEELAKTFRAVDGAGVMTSLDLAAVDEKSVAGQADWKSILEKTLPSVDFFMPSFEELAFMLDRVALEKVRARAQDGDPLAVLSVEEDVEPLADRAISLGAKVVLVKCGAKGLYYRTASREKMESLAKKSGMWLAEERNGDRCGLPEGWIDRKGFEKSYAPERVLSATGAGDTTIAAFLVAMLEGYPFERCLQLATATGASCVESYDALGGLRPFAELERKIKSGWKKSW